MYQQDLINTIHPDHPAESAVCIVAHSGDLEFVEITSVAGSDEVWSLQLDREQAQKLADSLRDALALIDQGVAETER